MPSKPTVFAVDEYESQEFDAVLVQENAVVCLNADPPHVRIIPMDKVNHVDADPELLLGEAEIPESFYGGAEYGFADPEEFDELREHREALDREEY
jgi:hypothetical protein